MEIRVDRVGVGRYIQFMAEKTEVEKLYRIYSGGGSNPGSTWLKDRTYLERWPRRPQVKEPGLLRALFDPGCVERWMDQQHAAMDAWHDRVLKLEHRMYIRQIEEIEERLGVA